MTHDLSIIAARGVRIGWGFSKLITVGVMLLGCTSEPPPNQPSQAAARQDSQSGERREKQFKAQENQLIDEAVKEYNRDPARYDRAAAQIISDVESVQYEAARMREQHGIAESEWAAAIQELSRGRPLSQPLYNSDVLEYILKKR